MRTLVLIGLFLMTACAPVLEPKAMMPQMTRLHHSSQDVRVVVLGTSTALSVSAPVRVTDDGFAAALTGAIEQAGLFRTVVRDGMAYQLEAMVEHIDEDIFGLDMTARIRVRYALAQLTPKASVWSDTITSEHTAGLKDSVLSITRIQMATEAAVRKNIDGALHKIATLQLP